MYEQVRAEVEASGRDFRKELNDLYVSPLLAKALLKADPNFATSEPEAKNALRAQFLKPKDISTEEFVQALQDTLATDGQMPGTVVIFDEVQQYIGDDASRSFIVQEVVESLQQEVWFQAAFCGNRADSTPVCLRCSVCRDASPSSWELSDSDVETVTRRVVLAKEGRQRLVTWRRSC